MTSKIKLQEPGPKVTKDQIEAFEREIGGALPDDYKQFLLRHNGGLASPELALDWRGRRHTIVDFRPLVAASDSGLRRALVEIRQHGVVGKLPIVRTLSGREICVDFANRVGTIWLAVFVLEHDVPVGVDVEPIAKSFADFCGMLTALSEPHCQVESLGRSGCESDLQQFIASGNSIDRSGMNGLTIICEAIRFSNDRMIEACLARNASLSQSIHLAAVNGRPDLIRRLVAAGADVNEPDKYGEPPLRYVCGTDLPGGEGAVNRAVRDILIDLGATL